MPESPQNVTPMTRYRGVVESTGEVIGIDAPAVRGRKRKGKRRMFALMDLEALDRLELSAQEWEVLTRVMRAVNPETNEAAVSIAQIADDLAIFPAAVSRTMKNLRERLILFTLRRGVHRINTYIMFRGSAQDWETVTASEREPLWRR